MTPDTTDIQEFEQEILVQGHPGTIYGLTSSLEDQFVSSGKQFNKPKPRSKPLFGGVILLKNYFRFL